MVFGYALNKYLGSEGYGSPTDWNTLAKYIGPANTMQLALSRKAESDALLNEHNKRAERIQKGEDPDTGMPLYIKYTMESAAQEQALQGGSPEYRINELYGPGGYYAMMQDLAKTNPEAKRQLALQAAQENALLRLYGTKDPIFLAEILMGGKKKGALGEYGGYGERTGKIDPFTNEARKGAPGVLKGYGKDENLHAQKQVLDIDNNRKQIINKILNSFNSGEDAGKTLLDAQTQIKALQSSISDLINLYKPKIGKDGSIIKPSPIDQETGNMLTQESKALEDLNSKISDISTQYNSVKGRSLFMYPVKEIGKAWDIIQKYPKTSIVAAPAAIYGGKKVLSYIPKAFSGGWKFAKSAIPYIANLGISTEYPELKPVIKGAKLIGAGLVALGAEKLLHKLWNTFTSPDATPEQKQAAAKEFQDYVKNASALQSRGEIEAYIDNWLQKTYQANLNTLAETYPGSDPNALNQAALQQTVDTIENSNAKDWVKQYAEMRLQQELEEASRQTQGTSMQSGGK